jgi:hypothetical protein
LAVPDGALTEFAQAMPEQYKVPGDAVAAYQAYYIGEKWEFAQWTRRPAPEWYLHAMKEKFADESN